MSDEAQPGTSRPPRDSTPADRDMILDLNFVPTWAREAPDKNPYLHVERKGRERRPERRGDSRRPARRPGRRPAPRQAAPRRPRHPAEPELPVFVSFVPDREQLSRIVRSLHVSKKAYSLRQIADLFLSHPAHCRIKLELPGDTDVRLYVCPADDRVFMRIEECEAFLFEAHASEFFEEEEIEVEAPKGNFTGIARCGLSGAVLGPPNYHGFTERLREIWQRDYAHMPLEEYRRYVETVREPEVIEQWKNEMSHRRVYRLKSEETAEPMTRAEAQKLFNERFARRYCKIGRRAVISSRAARELGEGVLKRRIRDAWTLESRHHRTLMRALRPAFSHMGLFLFKTNRGATFVCAVRPHPIDPARAIPSIRKVLEYLQEHPGCPRGRLIEALRPGAAPDDPRVTEVLSNLRWLIERGHVVEFFDGSLAVIGSRSPKPNETKA